MSNVTQVFIGTKLVAAEPMKRGPYNTLRGWDLPFDENGEDDGYLVEYMDGGPANVPGYAGYVSWSPKDVFERAYRVVNGMRFGDALNALELGGRVARTGWNGTGMFLFLVKGSRFQVNRPPLLGIYAEGTTIDYRSHIDMKTAQGDVVPWVASQTDLLADDWTVVGV